MRTNATAFVCSGVAEFLDVGPTVTRDKTLCFWACYFIQFPSWAAQSRRVRDITAGRVLPISRFRLKTSCAEYEHDLVDAPQSAYKLSVSW